MEKKIEIGKPFKTDFGDYDSQIRINGIVKHSSYGSTPEEAVANAQIAASGYLVEELVECLKEFVEMSPCQNGCSEDDMTCLTSKSKYLLTKATNTK